MKANKLALILISCACASIAQVKVNQGGNVSVGSTVDPPWNFKMQVIGNSVFSYSASTITSSAYIRGLNAFSTATNPDYTWFNNDQVGLFHPAINILGFTTFGSERMRINDVGNLCIGSASDIGSKLNVTANTDQRVLTGYINQTSDYQYASIINVNRALTKVDAVYYNGGDRFYTLGNGSVYSNVGYYTFSDKSLKENVKAISNARAKILSLTGYTYNLKEEKVKNDDAKIKTYPDLNKKNYIGFIAQEVEKIVPEVVETMDNGLKAVNYPNMVALLVEGIKEQDKKIEELEQKIQSLQNNYLDSGIRDDKSLIELKKNNALYQNEPNPFEEKTTIKYLINGNVSSAKIYILDMSGSLIKTFDKLTIGNGEVLINERDLKPGMYYYSLYVNEKEIETKKMILTR